MKKSSFSVYWSSPLYFQSIDKVFLSNRFKITSSKFILECIKIEEPIKSLLYQKWKKNTKERANHFMLNLLSSPYRIWIYLFFLISDNQFPSLNKSFSSFHYVELPLKVSLLPGLFLPLLLFSFLASIFWKIKLRFLFAYLFIYFSYNSALFCTFPSREKSKSFSFATLCIAIWGMKTQFSSFFFSSQISPKNLTFSLLLRFVPANVISILDGWLKGKKS